MVNLEIGALSSMSWRRPNPVPNLAISDVFARKLSIGAQLSVPETWSRRHVFSGQLVISIAFGSARVGSTPKITLKWFDSIERFPSSRLLITERKAKSRGSPS